MSIEDHGEGTTIPTLVYLYGPPAAGKLTIAELLAQFTGFRLFHNHLSVNAISSVFPIGTEPYVHVFASAAVGRIRDGRTCWDQHDLHQ